MAEKSVKYRLDVYSKFAKKAKQEGIKWVVAHGSEGYPDTIGRDLDVLCYSKKDILHAVQLFKNAAKLNEHTKWIIEPHPIWGKRVLAISNNYEVAELHILYKLNSGLIDSSINWNLVSDALFPTSPKVTYFKSVVMPLMGGTVRLDRISSETIDGLGYSLKRIYYKMKKHGKITSLDKILAYLQLGGGNFLRMWRSYLYSKSVKKLETDSPTTPVYIISKASVEKLKDSLGEIFLKFVDGDNLTHNKITYHQARQRFVYLSKPRSDIPKYYDVKKNEGLLQDAIVNAFEQYNLERQELYDRMFLERCRFVKIE